MQRSSLDLLEHRGDELEVGVRSGSQAWSPTGAVAGAVREHGREALLAARARRTSTSPWRSSAPSARPWKSTTSGIGSSSAGTGRRGLRGTSARTPPSSTALSLLLRGLGGRAAPRRRDRAAVRWWSSTSGVVGGRRARGPPRWPRRRPSTPARTSTATTARAIQRLIAAHLTRPPFQPGNRRRTSGRPPRPRRACAADPTAGRWRRCPRPHPRACDPSSRGR